ncbi:MAG: hypothetical protein ACPGWR_26820 [Ardenticatenaceae bacterium]
MRIQKIYKYSSILSMTSVTFTLLILIYSLTGCSMPTVETIFAEGPTPTVVASKDNLEGLEISLESTTPTPTPTVVSVANSVDLQLQLEPALIAEVESVRAQVHKNIQRWLAGGDLARPNGYVYAIDIAQLLIYFADVGDLENYNRFRQLALDNLIINDRSDPFTQGFVGWRYSPSEPVDASGTTEALWIANGLWKGFQQFYDPTDEELAQLILNGYAEHGFVDQQVWFIRNYFNFETRAFAPNSYMVNYHPDFVQEVASKSNNDNLTTLAENSNQLIRQSQAPSGLLHSIVLPELKTLYPEFNVVVFSPNDIIQLSNACAIAETAVETDPELGRQVLSFAENNFDDLKSYYYGHTGEPAHDLPARFTEWTCLVRLSARLNDATLTPKLIEQALPFWKSFSERPGPPRLYQAGQMLLTIDAIIGN